jgi:hypothetical protein
MSFLTLQAQPTSMKPPKPTEGSARHCWGRRRRHAKKLEKGLWKAMAKLGILQKAGQSSESCSWEETWTGRFGRIRTPYIAGWEAPSPACDDWSEWPVRNLAHNHCDAPAWENYDYDAMGGRQPEPIAQNDRHALRLLRQEIRARKR